MFNFPKNMKVTPEGEQADMVLDALGSRFVKVGYDESSGSYPDGTPVADVAAYNEYGTDSIPSRPFMRQAARDANENILKNAAGSLWDALSGSGGIEGFLSSMGERYKETIQESIDSGNFAPDAPATVEAKGSSQPLVDTGQLRDGIVVKIEGR